MDQIWTDIITFFEGPRFGDIVAGTVVLLFGLIAARYLSRLFGRLGTRRRSAQYGLIVRRLSFYSMAGLTVAGALAEYGLDLSILLGAAGILTVAFGFAAQTSASNLISGLFLLGERPFVVGDTVRIGPTTGVVLSIDLMSVKLRTFDNLLVRIPNETLLKSEITNLSFFPIRRLDIVIGIAYHEDLERARETLIAVSQKHPLGLDEPRPQVIFLGFGDSAVNLQLSVWAARETWFELKNTLQEQVKAALQEAAIEIPFPHRTLYVGSSSLPLPIRLITDADPPPGAEART